MSSEQAGSTPGPGAMSERMRALLSRAAEEQLLEQRQVSTVLGELRALVTDVDERLATGEQVERVAAEVRALSARVEQRLDAVEARSVELAERIGEATALAGRAAQDLVEAVAAEVASRVEAQLREVTDGLTASAERGERRLATHVDDAVLALAEVVLRRRTGQPAAPERVAHAEPAAAVTADDLPTGPPSEAPASPDDGEDRGPVPPDDDAAPTATQTVDVTPDPAAAPYAASAPDHAAVADDDPGNDDPAADEAAAPDEPAAVTSPEGFVLVPADVEEPDAGPAPPVPQERRTAERRGAARSDGSGRRRRPWWRPVSSG